MSQMTAPSRVAGRPQRPAAPGGALRVIRGTVDRPRSGVFAGLCLTLLVAGFLLVLVLNTAMAKGSFVLDDLQARSGALTDSQGAMARAIDAESAPSVLAQRALKLGMVPSSTAAFLDLSDGKVLGVATAAKRVPGFTVITSPTPVFPKKTVVKKPTTTVTKKGSVTTTTVVTPKADGTVVTKVTKVDAKTGPLSTTTTVRTPKTDGTVVTTVTAVDAKTKVTTTTTTVVKAPVKPATTAPATAARPGATATPTTGPTTPTTTPTTR